MKFFIISGFLGSGKTITIKNLISQLGAEEAKKTALIINDFGEIGVDASVLGSTGMKPVELLSGCVCCQLGEDLQETVTELYQNYQPKRVILEPSGIAQPSEIVKLLAEIGLFPPTDIKNFVLVDPVRLNSLLEFVGPVIEKGITVADLLVITKTDLISEQDLDQVRTKLREMNPRALMMNISNLQPETLSPLREVVIHEL